jgi:chromosome segregation ATPase
MREFRLANKYGHTVEYGSAPPVCAVASAGGLEFIVGGPPPIEVERDALKQRCKELAQRADGLQRTLSELGTRCSTAERKLLSAEDERDAALKTKAELERSCGLLQRTVAGFKDESIKAEKSLCEVIRQRNALTDEVTGLRMRLNAQLREVEGDGMPDWRAQVLAAVVESTERSHEALERSARVADLLTDGRAAEMRMLIAEMRRALDHSRTKGGEYV